MKTRNGAFWGVAGGILASICGCSLCSGQLVTQPPAKAPNPADHIAVAPIAPPKAMPRFDPPSMPINPTPAKSKAQIVLPDLPYAPLGKGADGKVTPLVEPAEYAALRVNPMLKPEDLGHFGKYLDERRGVFERIVADNLDLIEQIEGGIFENLDLSDNKAFSKLLDVSKPLRAPSAPKPLIDELLERQQVDPTQAEFNRKIVREYHLAIMPAVKADASPKEKGEHARRSLALFYKQGLEEPLFVHRQLLLEASGKLDKIIPGLGLDAATATKVNSVAAGIKPNSPDAARMAAMDQISKDLTLDQRKAMLRKVVELRAK